MVFCVNNVAARLTTFLDLFGNDNNPERVDVTVRRAERVVKYLFVVVERSLVVAVRDTETVGRELFVLFDVSRVRIETDARDTAVVFGWFFVVVVRLEFCTTRSAPLAIPIDTKHDKTAKRKPFFLILIKYYQKNFLWGNKKMHHSVHFKFKKILCVWCIG